MPFDIWLFSSTAEGELPLQWGGNARAVNGIELLVNIFTLVFLTELESDLAQTSVGTDLGGKVGGNISSSEQIFMDTVFTSVRQAVNIISADQDETTPLDETLVSASILNSELLGDILNVKVELVSAAGETRVIKVPTKTVI